MRNANEENKKCIITWDINVDGLTINKNNQGNIFKTTLEHKIPTITLPSRIMESQVLLIDHILINTNVMKHNRNITTGNIYSDIIAYKQYSKYDRPLIRIYGGKGTAKYNQPIAESSCEEFYNAKDENKALNIFYTICNTSINKAFPLKHLSYKIAKYKKWITSGLKASIQIKNKLYKDIHI